MAEYKKITIYEKKIFLFPEKFLPCAPDLNFYMKKIIPFLFYFTGISGLFAQPPALDVFSDGALISVYSDSVWIDGNFLHANNDTIINFGNIYLTGNWTNNNSTGKIFTSGTDGWLRLVGDTQTIAGNSLTHFNNLELAGTGLKKLVGINAHIEDTLQLNDRIFDVDTNVVTVLANGNVTNANGLNINTTSDSGGYVSSENNGGLERVIKSTNTYFFPVGSYNGTDRYRPLELTFNSAPSDTVYKVRMANVNPTADSYNINDKDTTLCDVNSNFYHRIYHSNGTDNADITIYYDNAADGNFQTIAHWEGTPSEWKNTLNNTFTASSVTKTNWSDFSTNPFALAKTLPAKPQILQNDTSFCEGGNVTLTATAEPGVTYSWSNGLTSPNISVIASGNYSVTVTSPNGCTASSDTISITVFPTPSVSVTATPGTIICQGDSIQLIANGTGTFNWSTGETTSSIYVDSSATYIVTITDANNCTNTDNVTVSVSQFSDSLINAGGSTTICEGEFLTLVADSGYLSYQWFLNGILIDTTQAITVDSAGNYTLLVTDSSFCKNDSAATFVTVTVNPSPDVTASKDTTIHFGTSGTLTAAGASSYTWFLNNQQVSTSNPFVVSPTEETTYMVVGSNGNCSDTVFVKVSVDTECRPGIPNIFSPNDDMFNDEFKVVGYGFEFQYITIFDRWGNKIMETNDINTGWNGKLNNSGENLNNGVYVYILKYKCLHSGEEYQKQGNVTLTR